MKKSASFSPDMEHRNYLSRIWDATYPTAMCIGLNPSTANGEDDDSTIRILIKVLTRLGYGGFYMLNLFSVVSSKPEILSAHPNPVGNADEYLQLMSRSVETVIFCWGDFKQAYWRAKVVIPMFPDAKCFGYARSGAPLHPMGLMWSGQMKTAELIDFKKQ